MGEGAANRLLSPLPRGAEAAPARIGNKQGTSTWSRLAGEFLQAEPRFAKRPETLIVVFRSVP
jgi:hypothetical protein